MSDEAKSIVDDEKGDTGSSDATKDVAEGGDGKSLIGDQAEGKSGVKDDAKPEGAKNVVEIKLKLPEGTDESSAEAYVTAAKKYGVKSEVVQEFFDLALKERTSLENEISSLAAKTQEKWLAEARKDPEIGGDKFKESVAYADGFVRRFGGEALMEALIRSGMGKHPAILKAFAKAGAALSEDKISGTTGGKVGASKKTEKQTLMEEFPNSPDMWKHLPD